MSAAIAGLGTARPAESIAQSDAAEFAKTLFAPTHPQARLLPVLYGRTGVGRRGSVLLERTAEAELTQSFFPPAGETGGRGPTTRERMERYAEEAAPLAQEAAGRALQAAGLAPRAITHLVTVSCTGFVAPGVDLALVKRLGLSPTIGRTHVGFMGCHGALNGLRVAAALVGEEPGARVLLCAVELCSLHVHYGWDPEKIVANALFADGAGALILAPASSASAEAWQLAASGSSLLPDSEDAMTWRIGDHGFEMTLSPRVPSLIGSQLRPWLVPWLAHHRLAVEDVHSWAIHPGGPRVLDAVATCLGLSAEAMASSADILAECGNMSSATTVFLLERLRERRAQRPCVALAFGPGLAVEVALFC